MRRNLAVVSLLALWVGLLQAEEKPRAPKGTEPRQARAWVDNDGALVLREYVCVAEGRKSEVEPTNEFGKTGDVDYQGPKEVTFQEVKRRFVVDGIQAYTTSGKRVAAKDLPNLLKKEQPVLISSDGEKVDPYYLEMIKEGTLVLVLRRPKD